MISFKELSESAQSKIKTCVEEGKPHLILYDVENSKKRVGVMVDYKNSDGFVWGVHYFFDKYGFHTRSKRYILGYID